MHGMVYIVLLYACRLLTEKEKKKKKLTINIYPDHEMLLR